MIYNKKNIHNEVDKENINNKIKEYFIIDEISLPQVSKRKIVINNKEYTMIKLLSTGSYGKIYLYLDETNMKYYIIKVPINNESIKAINAEIKIHGIISAFQKLYLENKVFEKRVKFHPKIVPEIKYFFTDKITGLKNIMMEKYDGDIYKKLTKLDVTYEPDKLFLLELLYQLSCQLKILQKYFQFMHNDLKGNNIFYKLINGDKELTYDNIRFVLGDFGGSYIKFNNFIIQGDIKGIENNFNPNKDLFMLVHIIITFINSQNRRNLIIFLKTLFNQIDETNTITENDKWHNLYILDNYPNEYNPKKFLNKLEQIYPQFKRDKLDCFSIIDNEILSNKEIIKKKYKIHY